MTELRNLDTDQRISQYVNPLNDQDVIKVTHRTLDGQHYVQLIGSPAAIVEMDVYVDLPGKALLLQADAAGNLLLVSSSKGSFQGRILERGSWSKVGTAWFKTTLKLGVVTS